jgi:hypothetical protein
MSVLIPSLAVVTAAAGVVVGIATAAPAAAVPQCTNTGLTTTQCERPGNAQINTAPSYNNNQYPFGWPFWGSGITIGLGGLGI